MRKPSEMVVPAPHYLVHAEDYQRMSLGKLMASAFAIGAAVGAASFWQVGVLIGGVIIGVHWWFAKSFEEDDAITHAQRAMAQAS